MNIYSHVCLQGCAIQEVGLEMQGLGVLLRSRRIGLQSSEV